MAGLINSTFQAAQPGTSLDTSSYPNPFYGLGNSANGGYLDADETELRLLDGGLDGAVTPYQPLLVPARQVDVIIGFDAVSALVRDSSLVAHWLMRRSLPAGRHCRQLCHRIVHHRHSEAHRHLQGRLPHAQGPQEPVDVQ